jgi:WD40 repeat protein
VVSGSGDNTLKVWDLETGREIKTLRGHFHFVDAVAIMSDGNKAVSGSDDKTIRVWDLENGQEIITLEGHTDWVNAVVVTSDGRNALSGSRDSTLKVWDLESGQMIVEFSGDGAITSIALAPDGRTVIAGEVSGRVHFLRLENSPVRI